MRPGARALLKAGAGVAGALLAAGPLAAAPASPPAPNAIDMSTVETITLRNDVCEAQITVKPFVHLLGFHFLGAKNDLLHFDTPNPPRPDGTPMRPTFIVGGKLWYAPEVADTHKFAMLSGTVTHTALEADALLDPDPVAGLRGRIRFVLDAHRPVLTVASAIRNVGAAPRATACWWPVSFAPGGRMEAVPVAAPEEPAYSYHFWSYGGTASEPACRIAKDLITLDMDRPLQTPIFKIGFLGREIVLRKPDAVFRLTALDPPLDPRARYPHGGSPVMLYCDQRSGFCEAELSGPLVDLAPGAETAFTFAIALERRGHRQLPRVSARPSSRAKSRDQCSRLV